MDDVLTTTGSGTLLCGKKALEDYISGGGDSKMYWIRETKEIKVNEKRKLAWEQGSWKIRSQLFVNLGEEEKK